MTEEQKARWLEMIKENGSLISWMSSEEDWSHVILRRDEAFALCATVAREVKREALNELIAWIEVRKTDHAETPEPDLHDVGQVWAFERVLREIRRIAALEDET